MKLQLIHIDDRAMLVQLLQRYLYIVSSYFNSIELSRWKKKNSVLFDPSFRKILDREYFSYSTASPYLGV